ncbi:MAG: hypothetical protein WCI41_02960 [bacterium]
MVKEKLQKTNKKEQKGEIETREQLLKKLSTSEIDRWENDYTEKLKDPNHKLPETAKKVYQAKLEIINKIREMDKKQQTIQTENKSNTTTIKEEEKVKEAKPTKNTVVVEEKEMPAVEPEKIFVKTEKEGAGHKAGDVVEMSPNNDSITLITPEVNEEKEIDKELIEQKKKELIQKAQTEILIKDEEVAQKDKNLEKETAELEAEKEKLAPKIELKTKKAEEKEKEAEKEKIVINKAPDKKEDKTKIEEETEKAKKQAEEAEKAKTAEENELLKKSLEEAREKYATGYKEYVASAKKDHNFATNFLRNATGHTYGNEDDKKHNFAVNAWKKVWGSYYKDKEIPEELKNLEKEYNAKIIEYGNKMYADKKKELAGSDKTKEEQDKELAIFKNKEIFEETIIKEGERLNAMKVENLPPKEKALWKQGLEWYMKQKGPKKAVLTVLLTAPIFALISPASVAAAGGTGLYLGVRALRGVVGSTIGLGAVKLYDVSIKERFTERKQKALDELSAKFKEDMTDEEMLQYKKEYQAILDKEAKQKRNRTIHKAMIAAVAGGAASIGTGAAITHFQAEHLTHAAAPAVPHEAPKVATPEPNFKPVSVQFSSKGAIQTIENLKSQIHNTYPDISKAPHSIQELMHKSSVQIAKDWGFYDPTKIKESLMLLKNSILSSDNHGNISYTDASTGQIHTVVAEHGNIETVTKYGGKMFDAHHTAEHANVNPSAHVDGKYAVETQHPISTDNLNQNTGDNFVNQNINGNTLHPNPGYNPNYQGEGNNYNYDDASVFDPNRPIGGNQQYYYERPQQGYQPYGEGYIDNGPVFDPNHPIHGHHGGYDNQDREFYNSPVFDPNHPTGYHNHVIKRLFPDERGMDRWNNIRNSHGSYSARNMISSSNGQESHFRPVVEHMRRLRTATGLDPMRGGLLGKAESPEEYIFRATKRAGEMGKLDDINIG